MSDASGGLRNDKGCFDLANFYDGNVRIVALLEEMMHKKTCKQGGMERSKKKKKDAKVCCCSGVRVGKQYQ